jgi:ferric-dicitrate binding protein FerR (iron transport regulator)
MTARTIRYSLVVALTACATAQAQKAGAVDAVRPQATIQRNVAELPAEKGTDVAWNDLLRTGEQGRVRVLLLDQSLISVGPKSEVRVVQRAPASDQGNLELAYGKVRMRLAKQPGQRFELRTPTAVAGVIGTDFGADASVPGATHFICLEGEVRISNVDPQIPGTVICRGGYMTDVKAGQPPAEPTPATADHMENWRRNNEPDGDKAVPDHMDHHQ